MVYDVFSDLVVIVHLAFVVFVLFGLLLVFSQSSAVAPFIYTLF